MANNDGSTVGHAYFLGHPYFEDYWHKKGRKTCDLHPHIFTTASVEILHYFSNFSCMFLNPNIFFIFEF